MKKIFFLAPVATQSSNRSFSPAGNKKIFLLLRSFCDLGWSVVLLNSLPASPNGSDKKGISIDNLNLDNNIKIKCYSLITTKSFGLSYLSNLINCRKLYEYACVQHGVPALNWAYNGYAIEMKLARFAFLKYHVKTILEFEDWHFSRLSLPWIRVKYFIDFWYWLLAIPSICFSFVVDDFLAAICRFFGISTMTLPGAISQELSNYHYQYPILQSPIITCAYFGGLTFEKGAGFLIELIKLSIKKNLPVQWIVSGVGPLSCELRELSHEYPSIFRFYGFVDDPTYHQLLQQADICLNPHKKTSGVFPFKIVEAVACGKIVVSSPINLPDSLEYIQPSLKQVELDITLWLKVLDSLYDKYCSNLAPIQKAAIAVNHDFSYSSITAKVDKVLSSYL